MARRLSRRSPRVVLRRARAAAPARQTARRFRLAKLAVARLLGVTSAPLAEEGKTFAELHERSLQLSPIDMHGRMDEIRAIANAPTYISGIRDLFGKYKVTGGDAALAALEAFDPASTEAALRALADARGVKAGVLIHAVRVALAGKAVSPGLFDVLALLGRHRVHTRLAAARRLLLTSTS